MYEYVSDIYIYIFIDAMGLELSGELFKIDHNILLGTYNASTKTHVET